MSEYDLNGVTTLENQDLIKWSGDNINYGRESVLINVKNYKEYFINSSELKARFGARWYSGDPGNQLVDLKFTCYKGGEMILSSSEFAFYNVGGSKIGEITLPSTYINSKSGCGTGTIDNVYYTSLFHNNIGLLDYDIKSNTLKVTALTGYVGGNYISDGNYSLSPDPLIPTTPTQSISTIQDAITYKSVMLWSDGVITENIFTGPFFLPDGTYGGPKCVINSRKFTTPGIYTIVSNTFYYTDAEGVIQSLEEPYNITFVVS